MILKRKIKTVYENSPFLIKLLALIRKTKAIVLRPFKYVASKSTICSSLYFSFLSRDFGREQKATLAGSMEFEKGYKNVERNSSQLRRNIHRLEKGLLMKPRKPIFALSFIQEAVELYENALNKQEKIEDIGEIEWAHNVLREYFHVCKGHRLIEKCKNQFEACKFNPSSQAKKPYTRENSAKSTIEYEQFLQLTKQRRSIRWFLQKNVPRELIDKAIIAAGLSPSACNRQPFEFRVIDDPNLVKKAIKLPLGTRGYDHNVPVLVVVVGKLNCFMKLYDRHLIYIDSSLASMSFMLSLETLGLSSCPINWQDIRKNEKGMAKLLGLRSWEKPIMCIALGYPDPQGGVAYSQKKSLAKIRRYNNEKNETS